MALNAAQLEQQALAAALTGDSLPADLVEILDAHRE